MVNSVCTMKILCSVIWMSGVLLMLPSSTHNQFMAKAFICGRVPFIPKGDITSFCKFPPPNPSGLNKQSTDGLIFKAVLLPFEDSEEAVWLHVHVGMESNFALSNKQNFIKVALMAQNIFGYPIGEWVDELPCQKYRGPSDYVNGVAIDEYDLNKKQATKILTLSCPKTPYDKNRPPNFLNMEFTKAITSFYVTVKLSKEELKFVYEDGNSDGLSGIRIVMTHMGGRIRSPSCYADDYSEFFVIKEKSIATCDRANNTNVPVECHRCALPNIVVKAEIKNVKNLQNDRLINNDTDYHKQSEINKLTPGTPKRPVYPPKYNASIIEYLDKDKPTTTKAPVPVPAPSTTITTTPAPSTTITTTPAPSTAITTTPAPSTDITKTPAPSTAITKTSAPSTAITRAPTPSTVATKAPIPIRPTALVTAPGKPTYPKTTSIPNRSTKPPDINDNTALELDEIPKDDMYNECGRTKGCVGQPPGCLATRSCSSIVSYSGETDKAAFQLFGKSEKYVAMGFSDDRLMGHDSVIECVREAGNVVRAYRSFNTLNRDNKRLTDHSPISRLKGKYSRREIYCEFLYPRQTVVIFEDKQISYDLEKEPFYVLYVDGQYARDGLSGNIGYHSESFVGNHKLSLLKPIGKSLMHRILEKIHGMTMIIVWFCIYPISNFLPRYFKETWTDVYIKEYAWWYIIHLILCGLTVFLTSFTTFCMTIALHGWGEFPWVAEFHLIAGFIINALIIIDVFLGFAVVKFNANFRYYSINFMHGFIGHIVFFLSCMSSTLFFRIIKIMKNVTIYSSRNIPGGMPCISTGSMIAFMVLLLIIHLAMNYQVCYTDFVQGKFTSRVYYSCGTLDLPGGTIHGDAPGSFCRKVLLIIFVVICLVFALILCVLYGHTIYADCREEQRIQDTADALAALSINDRTIIN